ncbi:gibberellin 20 oxidase 2-like [Andrographis paniculata]|uniref:gibberellin 20 oxidase 2-like n=1 Tax=Andrographis paniculata TaxID=175694 RepID=UPI0021E838EE|nr:gibberellin 20 oxidase 2-like [Andrographis paniculata]
MDCSTTPTISISPTSNLKPSDIENHPKIVVDDASLLEPKTSLPAQFRWPHENLVDIAQEEFDEQPVDLKGIFEGDTGEIRYAAQQINVACSNHGVFQVINHGIDDDVIQSMYRHMDAFFNLPLDRKMATKSETGVRCGYSRAHADRFSSKLPWKETFSFIYNHEDFLGRDVVDYIKSSLGEEFEEAGVAYKKYCKEMKALAMVIFELLAISLGVDRLHFKNFFEDGCSLMRGNNYPPCQEAGLTFGTGPHFDPNALTILHQDQVGGLEIFSDNKWRAIRPRPDAFVVNIGDTFMALCNGKYKSCMHRALVNKERARRSLVFFVNPKEDKVVSPPQDLLQLDDDINYNHNNGDTETPRRRRRQYPDFTWSEFRHFTLYHYRADTATLPNFFQFRSSNSLQINTPVSSSASDSDSNSNSNSNSPI